MADYFLLAARCLLATVFAVAALTKLRSASGFRRFSTTLQKLTALPERQAVRVAVGLIVGEALLTVLITLPLAPRAGFALATVFLLMFIGAVVRAVRRGVFAECRCFGDRSSVLSYPVLVRNALLLAIAAPGVVISPGVKAMDPAGVALALASGLTAAVAFIRYYDDLVRMILTRLHVSTGSSQSER
jgi:uncharacterized membrane protein YphA (DoxX/SURF4 family)